MISSNPQMNLWPIQPWKSFTMTVPGLEVKFNTVSHPKNIKGQYVWWKSPTTSILKVNSSSIISTITNQPKKSIKLSNNYCANKKGTMNKNMKSPNTFTTSSGSVCLWHLTTTWRIEFTSGTLTQFSSSNTKTIMLFMSTMPQATVPKIMSNSTWR